MLGGFAFWGAGSGSGAEGFVFGLPSGMIKSPDPSAGERTIELFASSVESVSFEVRSSVSPVIMLTSPQTFRVPPVENFPLSPVILIWECGVLTVRLMGSATA